MQEEIPRFHGFLRKSTERGNEGNGGNAAFWKMEECDSILQEKSKISPSLAKTFIWGLRWDFVCASPVAHQFGSVLSPAGIVCERLP